MKRYIPVLSIAGSDCSGGAGIQADIKTISALGGYAASAITAVTVQNSIGVTDIHNIPSNIVRDQIDAVMTDIKPIAVKVGMISESEIIKVICESIIKHKPLFTVVDPVMVSTSGCKLINEDAIDYLKSDLFPLSSLITPNIPEAEFLLNRKISNSSQIYGATEKLLELGCKNVLLKGGHMNGDVLCDVLFGENMKEPLILEKKKIVSRNTHGTGCTLSSAIATFLAIGFDISDSVIKACDYVYNGILSGKDVNIGTGHGPLNHFFEPSKMIIRES